MRHVKRNNTMKLQLQLITLYEHQWRSQKCVMEGVLSPLPLSPFPFLLLPSPFPPLPSLPLEVGPLIVVINVRKKIKNVKNAFFILKIKKRL